MAASVIDRNTPARYIERQIRLVLKSGQVIPAGVIVCTDATGQAVEGADTAALIAQGRSEAAASYAAGDREIVVTRGVFLFANNGTIVLADVGKPAHIVDNQTVADSGTTNAIVAGYIEEVTAEGVFVAMLGGKVGAS